MDYTPKRNKKTWNLIINSFNALSFWIIQYIRWILYYIQSKICSKLQMILDNQSNCEQEGQREMYKYTYMHVQQNIIQPWK